MRGIHLAPSLVIPAHRAPVRKDAAEVEIPQLIIPSGSEAQENWRITNDVADELYFWRDFGPGAGPMAGGAATVFLASGVPAIDYPNAGFPTLYLPVRRRTRWQRAGVEVKLWYTSPVGSTNNFVINFDILAHDSGDVLTAVVPTVTISMTIPGPAVANTELTATGVTISTAAIAGNKDCLTWRLYRNAGAVGDTNANSFYLTEMLIKVLPQ